MMLLFSCAQQSSPQGGPRDEQPPSVDSLSSTPNYQVFFEKQNIKIAFDEFVDIKQPGKSVLISPPMDINPRIYARGKEIRVEMPEDEELKENATYVFNFGNSIRDYTEGNELENFSFIFSTGPYIDSLGIKGKVLDAYSGEPSKETLVMLYDEFGDSVVYHKRPFYFTRTEDDGSYTIENLRSDSFKIFALKDDNVNYLYDLDTELIGFLDSLIFISDQDDMAEYNLKVFSPSPDFDLAEYDAKSYGKTILIFNQESDSVTVDSSVDMDYFNTHISGDSLIIWYDQSTDANFELYLKNDKSFFDTLKIRQLSKSDHLKDNKFKMISDNVGSTKIMKPTTHPIVYFNAPIFNIDQSKCYLLQDSITKLESVCMIDSLNPTALHIKYAYEVDSSYLIKIDSGAVINIYDQQNDSFDIEFTIGSESAFGKMIVFIDTFDFQSDYILELMSGEKIVKREIISSQVDKLVFELLDPKTYSIRLIKDDNKNGKWDPGSYKEKRFSEKIASKEIEAIREGWENEVRISMNIFDQEIQSQPIEEILKE